MEDGRWKMEDALLRYWDGADYLEGEEPGLYDLLGDRHYWDGVEWYLPEEVGTYNLNGAEHFWNGNSWE